MADQTIDIPGNPGVQLYEGDTLTINFITPAKFCISSGNADWFSPALPIGVAEPKDYQYVGTVTVASGTITYSHVGHDRACGSPNPKDVPPGTIQIGSGME